MAKNKEDVIEMIEMDSASSNSSVYTRKKLRNNKISSPHVQSPFSTPSKSEISEMFQVKSPYKSQNIKKTKKHLISNEKLSQTYSEGDASTSNDISEITSLKQQFSLESKSDTKSYRDRIKERFQTIKEQAEKSATKAHNVRNFKSHAERVSILNKSIEIMRRENMHVDKELQEYKKIHLEKSENISQADMYNFFCENNDIDVEISKNVDSVVGESTVDLISQKGDAICVYSPAEILRYNVQLSEDEHFYRPNRSPLSISDKIEGEQPYFAHEDGFYEPVLPKIKNTYLNIIERRLLNNGDTKWFRPDGKLNILENPLNYKTYHPRTYKHPKTEFTEYYPAKKYKNLEENLLSIRIDQENILRIYISSLKFTHHPLFSIEHVFAQKLVNLYDNYREKTAGNNIENLIKQLETLRNAIKTDIKSLGDAEKDKIITKVNKDKQDIKEMREKLFKESKELREITRNILKTWTTIKNIRKQNNYANTNIKLVIRTEKQNYKLDFEERKKQIAICYSEILLEQQEKNKLDLKRYKDELTNWKELDDKINKIKPKKPMVYIDKIVVKQEIIDNFEESFKPPGEPILNFNLTYDNIITENIENVNEKHRRNAVNTSKIHLRILCNNIEVCKSKSILLTDKFQCIFDEALSVKLIKIPQEITVEIIEHPNKLLKRKVGEIKLQIPKKKDNFRGLTEIKFTKNEIVHYKHEAVGSNINLSDLIKQYNIKNINYDEELITAGFLTYNLLWESINEDLTNKNAILNEIISDTGGIEVSKLKDWTENGDIDLENPENKVVFEYLQELENSSENKLEKCFRLNPELNKLMFCKFEDIEQNLRLKFLELRDRNEPEFVSLVIPNRLKEIPTNVMSAYKRRLNYNDNFYLDGEFDDSVDERRSKGRRYLQQIHTKVFQKCRCLQDNLEYEDVVDEKLIMYLENAVKSVLFNILNWLAIKPNSSQPLPKYSHENKSTEDVSISYSTQINICVISAHNLPTKSTRKGVNKTKQSMEEIRKNKESKIFIRVTYENVSLQTTSSNENELRWNETLSIPLQTKSTDYLSPNALNGSLVIDVFDEESIKQSESLQNLNSYEHWLGNIKIPIASICQSSKIEGLFHLNSPEVIFGYEQDFEKQQTNSPRFPTVQIMTPNTSYLNLKINIEPNIPKLHPNMAELSCNEPPYLKDHILIWNENCIRNFPLRKFSALAIDSNCKTTCITRFIRPLEPPQMNQDGFEVSPEQCARYISLIPFSDYNKVYEAIWQSTNNLLKTMIGSVYDHAVALTNFLLALNMESWLLLGFGVPHGSTAYVLIREYSRETNEPTHFIFDTSNAQKYNVTDVNSPLKRIYCCVNENNIWANIQRTDDMLITRFDFSKRGDWCPLFDSKVSAPTNSVQQRIMYRTVEDVQEVEYKLEKKLRKKIMKLRKMQRTIWNHDITNRFKSAMPRFEVSIAHGKYNLDLLELRNVLNSLTINGFLVSQVYTSAKSLCEFLKSTNVHLIEDENAEFILAVHLQPYANDVFAVWIVYAAIIK